MSLSIRPAKIADLNNIVELLISDALQRQAIGQTLWKIADGAAHKVRLTIRTAMENETPPFRQQWMLAEAGGIPVGITHSILLPVPPIYAGEQGAPGLIMEDCFVTDAAPAGTRQALLEAAESDLIVAGAKILLGSSVVGGAWEAEYKARNYDPLTLYLAKTGLRASADLTSVRDATEDDVDAIVASGAENRQILFDLNKFWKPHPDADARFGAWMKKSLTLTDRDMFVSEVNGALTGYAIAHPATPLHFPTPHDIGAVGVIDDFFHVDFADPATLQSASAAASELFLAAEAALEARGNEAALIVCPAAWTSKIAVLEAAGYRTAITWFIKS